MEEDLSPAQNGLNLGAILYLQTMKTFIVLFGILSVFNLPVYMLYAQQASKNYTFSEFSDIFALLSFGQMGNTLQTCD